MDKPKLIICLHCGESLPPDSFWGKRKTCIKCARALWYDPKSNNDPRKSENWPLVEQFVKSGEIRFPFSIIPYEPIDNRN